MSACNASANSRPVALKNAARGVRTSGGQRSSLQRAVSAAALFVAIVISVMPVQSEQLPTWKPLAPQYVQCPAPNQPLMRIPELVSQNGILRGTIALTEYQTGAKADDPSVRMFLGGAAIKDPSQCVLQTLRQLRGFNAILPDYPGTVPFGFQGYTPPPSYPGYERVTPSAYPDPLPGPTLRARVGDIVQLTFLNQLDPGQYWKTFDRNICDESTSYPAGSDPFPDCFHGSANANIHFHGTHTNPSSLGDNVLVELRPSPRSGGQPVVDEKYAASMFGNLFTNCETELKKNVLSQWPRTWADVPDYAYAQETLVRQYDLGIPDPANKLWPIDDAQRKMGAWPQYYIGAYPYCFRLPEYVPPTENQSAHPSGHNVLPGAPIDDRRAIQMGQAAGTHWYHAHKHGSTALNVSNGMTGAFIIEGTYDDALNGFYGTNWARTQPVLVVNQLTTGVNLIGGGGAATGPVPFSVNGRFQPLITMRPGEVQLWRIANTSSPSAMLVAGFAPKSTPAPVTPSAPQAFAWKQTAQDGVQFSGTTYAASNNPRLFIAPGNRADLLVKAPATAGTYVLLAGRARSRCEMQSAATIKALGLKCTSAPLTPLLIVTVAGTASTGNQAQFIPQQALQASFPAFLNDITDAEVTGTKRMVYKSTPAGPSTTHTIDGKRFDGNVGAVVLLNRTEEWKVVNETITTTGKVIVDHPFHIHINPFQISEFFDPNEVLPGTNTYKYIFSGKPAKGQCLLDINNPDTWKPCTPAPKTNLIWWDVFAIPSARMVNTTVVPGYFKMRSRFVDYTGQWVTHCHILAHEDRGMMTIVEVVPFTTPYSHK